MKHLLIIVAAVTTFLFSTNAFASHYDIADIELLPSAIQTKLIADGMETTEDLLGRLMTASDRKAFAQKYGVSDKDTNALAHKLELMQIIGVGPKAAELLTLAGVKSVKGLASADPNELLEALLAANRAHAITGVQPDMTVVKDWIEKAKKVKKHLS